MAAKATAPKQVLVLHKTLDILEALRKDGAGMGLTDLSRSVSMPKATIYRILTTLEMRGYLDRRENGSYQISGKLFSLQSELSGTQKLLQVAPAVMQTLAQQCRETVNLGTLDGGEVVVISTVESPQSIRMASKVGNRRCVHTSALGKALLAEMSDQQIRRLVQIKGLPRLTPNSVTSQSALLAELQRVRKDGYAVDNQENEMEGRCIAIRIAGLQQVEAALSISSPVFRMDLRRLRSFLPALRQSCAAIEKAVNN
jgi:IclR family transcriptional regulator, KDG regulon repressor